MRARPDEELQKYACIIIDEAQFLTKDEVFYLVHLVDDCGIPVLCYGLKGRLPGPAVRRAAIICWPWPTSWRRSRPSAGAARRPPSTPGLTDRGRVVKEGEQVVLGANDRYTSLCRRHWMAGDLGPDFDIHRT